MSRDAGGDDGLAPLAKFLKLIGLGRWFAMRVHLVELRPTIAQREERRLPDDLR